MSVDRTGLTSFNVQRVPFLFFKDSVFFFPFYLNKDLFTSLLSSRSKNLARPSRIYNVISMVRHFDNIILNPIYLFYISIAYYSIQPSKYIYTQHKYTILYKAFMKCKTGSTFIAINGKWSQSLAPKHFAVLKAVLLACLVFL